MSVCPSVCLSHASILSQQLNISSDFFSPLGIHTILVFPEKTVCQYFDGDPPNWLIECRRALKKLRFSTNISLYLRNDTRYNHGFYEMWMGNRNQMLLNGTSFNDLEWPLTQISRSHYYLMLNVLEMVRDTDKDVQGVRTGRMPRNGCMPHNVLRHHWLMPISCHFRDCKALLVTSLTHVSGAIASVQTFTFTTRQ